jgi:organic hydroperoxide reductase OsmC/OhrA
MSSRPRILTFDVSVDRERTATSALGGGTIERDEAWWAEHLLLVGLTRCTLTSLDYHARRTGLTSVGSGSAHGVVTKRDSDGRYAFVDFEVELDVEVAPTPDETATLELISKAERDCFVGNSLSPKPHYRWVVNGEQIP